MHIFVGILDFTIKLISIACFIVGVTIFIYPLQNHFEVYRYIILSAIFTLSTGITFYLLQYISTRLYNESVFDSIREQVDNDFMESTAHSMNHPRYYIDICTILFTVNVFIGYNMTGIDLALANSSILILYMLFKLSAKIFAEMFDHRMQNK